MFLRLKSLLQAIGFVIGGVAIVAFSGIITIIAGGIAALFVIYFIYRILVDEEDPQ